MKLLPIQLRRIRQNDFKHIDMQSSKYKESKIFFKFHLTKCIHRDMMPTISGLPCQARSEKFLKEKMMNDPVVVGMVCTTVVTVTGLVVFGWRKSPLSIGTAEFDTPVGIRGRITRFRKKGESEKD